MKVSNQTEKPLKIAFLYPGHPHDSVNEWIATLTRHAKDEVIRVSTSHDALAADCVFLVTQKEVYSREEMSADMEHLRKSGVPFGVVHNWDNPPVPTVNLYPSFCWTETAKRRLWEYEPNLLRQPVLPRCVEPKERPLHLGTFGRIEHKKRTAEMAWLAHYLGVPFTAFSSEKHAKWEVGPPEARAAERYLDIVRDSGGNIVVHPWLEKIEDLAPLCDMVSHWLFVLPPSKQGSGGSCTSPRCATAFGKPVIVVDDEDIFGEDAFYVIRDMRSINTLGLRGMVTPNCSWTPDAYVKTLVRLTKEYWE